MILARYPSPNSAGLHRFGMLMSTRDIVTTLEKGATIEVIAVGMGTVETWEWGL